jgi:hypothetical protein
MLIDLLSAAFESNVCPTMSKTNMNTTSQIIGAITTYVGNTCEDLKGKSVRIVKLSCDDPFDYVTTDRQLASRGGVRESYNLIVDFLDFLKPGEEPEVRYSFPITEFAMFAHLDRMLN